MAYEDDILAKLENSDNWPGFERPDFLDELNEIADNAYEGVYSINCVRRENLDKFNSQNKTHEYRRKV
jgi:hypothetical protein